MTLPPLSAVHLVANDPNTGTHDEYRCSKTGCEFRARLDIYGSSEARRLAYLHIARPDASFAELLEFASGVAAEVGA